ncbi:divergent PAP2 family protein [Prochlorococcus sp. MIT 1300]|uniref:divergent PAP2 family protein n=1 Tax=Prochlorococcus sp. MIT 1300 TaxID=3096218 RepID=UPI002A7566AB|nr:divergent PAP2 family protein [Prochlorococcus sp. MIT 1300]
MTLNDSSILEILDNGVLAWALAACGIAQLLKLVFEIVKYQRWRPQVLLETGGMPSSHSALVTGTAAGVGLELGFSHPAFAIASTVAFVVMYDASGIRRAAGVTAARVNLISSEINKEFAESQLKENLGHSRLEVFVGSLVGPAVVFPGMLFIGTPLDLLRSIGLS